MVAFYEGNTISIHEFTLVILCAVIPLVLILTYDHRESKRLLLANGKKPKQDAREKRKGK